MRSLNNHHAIFVVFLAVVCCLEGFVRASPTLYSGKGPITLLDENNFAEVVLGNPAQPFLVEFFAPWCGHCKALAPKFKRAAKRLSSVRVGVVDCDDGDGRSLCGEYGVEGFPTIKMFNVGKGPVDYNQARESDAIVEWSLQQASLGSSSTSTSSRRSPAETLAYKDVWNFLHNESPGKSVMLLHAEQDLSEEEEGEAKSSQAPGWLNGLAVDFKESVAAKEARGAKTRMRLVTFAFTDDKKIADRFGLAQESLPALLAFKPEQKNGGSYVRFEGEISERGDVAEYIVEMFGVKPGGDEVVGDGFDPSLGIAIPSFPQPSLKRKQPPAVLDILTHDNLFDKCTGLKTGMCVMGFVDMGGAKRLSDDLDFTGREAMHALSRKFRNDPLSFTLVDASQQPAFVSFFGSDPGDVPDLVILKTGRRPRYARFSDVLDAEEASFVQSRLNDFVDKALAGTGLKFARIKEDLPEFIQDWERDLFDEDSLDDEEESRDGGGGGDDDDDDDDDHIEL